MNEIKKSVCYKYVGVILTEALTWGKLKILVSLKVFRTESGFCAPRYLLGLHLTEIKETNNSQSYCVEGLNRSGTKSLTSLLR